MVVCLLPTTAFAQDASGGPAAPTITTQPTDQSVAEGEIARFSVTADSDPAPTCQWEINRNDGTGWVAITGAITVNYNTSISTLSDNGNRFRCIVTNAIGTVTSDEATLTVISKPKISGITLDEVFTKGDTVTFTAIGGGMDNTSPLAGDKRWLPTHWETNPSGDFSSGYTQSFSTGGMTLGAHMLSVTFTQQQYNESAWVDTGTTDTKSVSFSIVSSDTPPTGDASMPWLWIGLILIAGAGLAVSLLPLKKKHRA